MEKSEGGRADNVRRRSVLKGMSVAGFVGSLPNVTAAEGESPKNDARLDSETTAELQQMVREYRSTEKVRAAFADIGTPLLQTLKREGFINNHAIDSLPITEIIGPKEHTVGEEDGVMVVGVTTPKGPTVRMQVVKKTDKYTSIITLDVHTEEAHALVRNRENPSESSRVVSPNGNRDVGAMCTAGSYCKLVIEPNSVPCYTIDVECCLSQEYCSDIGELGSECTDGECYQHCLFACGICEDGSC